MQSARVAALVREVIERDYSLERYRLDDLVELLAPYILESTGVEEQKLQEAADEGWRQGFSEGKDDADDEIRTAIRQMRREAKWDSATLDELDGRVFW